MPPLKPGRPRIPPQVDRDTLEAMIASGLSTAQIAAQVGCRVEVVRVRRYGLAFPQHPTRRPDPPRPNDAAWLRREHHDRGMSLTDIARELGRARSTVAHRFRVYGIPIRHQRTYPELRDARWLDTQFDAGNLNRPGIGDCRDDSATQRAG